MEDIVLFGNIVRLRLLREQDAEITFRWRHSERAKYLNQGATTVEEQRNWILRNAESGDLNFVIEFQRSPVGMLSLVDIDHTNHSCSTGRLLIGEEVVVGNAPVVFDAERVLLDYAFEELRIHSIYGPVMGTNTGVLKLRRYLHYQQAGVYKDHYFVDGKYVDAILFSLLKDDYYKKCRRIMQAAVDLYLKHNQTLAQ